MTDALNGGGELGARMRALDWARTPVGPPGGWPQSLRSAVGICLNSRFPIAIYWGPELALLYNDAWSPIPGEKHPWALGRPGHAVWPEIWPEIGPLFEAVQRTGEGVWQQDQLLPMHRHGYTEECYFNFTFSPIRGEDGAIAGIFNAVVETTFRVIEERRAQLLRDLSERTGAARSAAEACALAAEVLAASPADVPFCLFYLRQADDQALWLAAAGGAAPPPPLRPPALDPADPAAPWPAEEALRSSAGVVVEALDERFGVALPSGVWPEAVERAVVVPIAGVQATEPAGLLVAGLSPRRALDGPYSTFVGRVALQVATAIGNAGAYEAERQRAEALAALDRAKTAFFSNISHEFRTPLTLMLGPLEDLLDQAGEGLPPRERDQLGVVHRNALRLLRLVNTLLDFSRIEAGRAEATYEPTDLPAFTAGLASVFRSAVERAGLELVVSCPPLAEPAYVDRRMWEQIVFNLLSNAFKFTFEGAITVELRRAGPAVELTVRDTGTGIPADELPHLFERFHRVRGAHGRTFEGSGIGLALVQELARLHGGAVSAASEPGRGSSFTVAIPLGAAHLPAERIVAPRAEAAASAQGAAFVEEALRWLPEPAPDEPAPPRDELPALAAPSAGGRILLADDNADMRAHVSRLLGQQHEVVAVADGAAALEAARARPWDLVLADVMMPRLDGFGLLAALRADERTRTMPVILLSARAGEEARVEGLQAGADDYLVKPFSARELLARVDAHLALARLRQGAEAAVRQSEAQLRLVMDALPALISYTDSERRYRFVNKTYTAWFGHAPEQVIGRHLWDVLGEAAYEAARPFIDQALAGHAVTFERLLPYRHGGDRFVQVNYIPDRAPDGAVKGYFALVTDLTERKRRELNAALLAEVGSALARPLTVEAIMATVGEQIGRHMAAARVVFVELDLDRNQTFVRYDWRAGDLPSLVGTYALDEYATGEFLRQLSGGTPVAIDDVRASPITAAAAERFLALGIGASLDAPYISDGRLKFLLAVHHGRPHAWRADEVELVVTLAAHSWTRIERARAEIERERLLAREQELRQQAELASRLKDEFLATVSHELRTPLTAFLGYAHLLQSRKRDEAYTARTVEKMLQSAKTQAQLIEDLLDVSRIMSGKMHIAPRETNLIGVVHAALDTVRPAIEAKGLRLRLALDPAASSVIGDAGRLQQVVWNLLSNAAKFTPAGGTITVRLAPGDGEVLLTVSDTGQGISPAFLPHVFDRFRQADSTSTRAYGGLGLGLSIVRHLVELHGGTVEVASDGPGLGAVFTVRLPRPGERGAGGDADAGGDAADHAELRGLRVLVVDDQPEILDLLHEVLAAAGATVRPCAVAPEALTLLPAWRPDVLVSDIAMPDHDGYWLIDAVRALGPEQGGAVPAVALTAYVRAEERARVLAAGYQLYLPKPVEPAALRAAVARLARQTTLG